MRAISCISPVFLYLDARGGDEGGYFHDARMIYTARGALKTNGAVAAAAEEKEMMMMMR
jgi:hypothetical protein